MNTLEILDVTKIEPKQKHPVIFQHFDGLEQGEAFIISNDHDPKPLYYQLLGERGNTFTWNYLKEGPALWRVEIVKKTVREGMETIGQIAAKDIRKTDVFRRMGIDFCCGGKQTLKDPAIKQMVARERNPKLTTGPEAGLVRKATRMMQMEHEISGEDLKLFRKITHDYALPEDACNSYTYLFEKIKEFESDLLQHIHLENNILFPAAAKLESKTSAHL